ncbi:hypothetical protein Pse7429DRAFT_0742 [Pseudanabaena biceps PCC 7429]|uniref:Uncharacterized protein n=3 Tax=Pseudanabaena TaxID=1152 RepID=L8N3G3_9CYAN|nr:hypothetical protein Pse7429DRAFT_0742 [Pseudanabaena biceps PCC 7429]
MTPEESKVLKEHLKAAAAILLNNTPKEELKSFNSIELAVRDHLLKEVAPEIGNFLSSSSKTRTGRSRKIQTSLGTWQIRVKQVAQLGLKKRSRLSPQLEANCLLLSANVSYEMRLGTCTS